MSAYVLESAAITYIVDEIIAAEMVPDTDHFRMGVGNVLRENNAIAVAEKYETPFKSHPYDMLEMPTDELTDMLEMWGEGDATLGALRCYEYQCQEMWAYSHTWAGQMVTALIEQYEGK